jgi:hypothetical protein
MDNLIFGKVINVKAAADGPDVGVKIEVFIQSQHMPIDLITWFGKSVTVKDQIEKLKKTPIEEEADRQRERDDARRFEALADMPQDKAEPRTCEYCLNSLLNDARVDGDGVAIMATWICLHEDGKPEQPVDLGSAWSCGNFVRRVAVVDAEDPVELCLAANCAKFEGETIEGIAEACCNWDDAGDVIELFEIENGVGNWLKHQDCLDATMKAIKELPAELENIRCFSDETHCDEARCEGIEFVDGAAYCAMYGNVALLYDTKTSQWLRCQECIEVERGER